MRFLGLFGVFFVCFVSGGATCARRQIALPLPPPQAFQGDMPTMHELAAAINRSANIRQLSTNSATVDVLTMPSLPRLSATLNLERDRRFRLQARLPIVLGAGIDLGSNDEVFWFEVPDRMSKTLYYARHDQYHRQINRAILPVDPTWVIDALGLVQVDPSTVVEGPVKRADGKLEFRSALMMPDGMYQRVCFVESSALYVTDQILYAPNGAEVARSTASNHVYYDSVQSALPHRVEIQLSPAFDPPLKMRIEVGSYVVNQLLSGDPRLFTMPTDAKTVVDLMTLSGASAVAPASAFMPPHYSANVDSAYPFRGSR